MTHTHTHTHTQHHHQMSKRLSERIECRVLKKVHYEELKEEIDYISQEDVDVICINTRDFFSNFIFEEGPYSKPITPFEILDTRLLPPNGLKRRLKKRFYLFGKIL